MYEKPLPMVHKYYYKVPSALYPSKIHRNGTGDLKITELGVLYLEETYSERNGIRELVAS